MPWVEAQAAALSVYDRRLTSGALRCTSAERRLRCGRAVGSAYGDAVGTPESRTVLIAGCGDLGTEVGLLFQSLGHHVVGVRRRAALLPAGFERQSVDLGVGRPVVSEDVAVVVVALTAPARTVEAYRRTYVDGLRNVLDGIRSARARPRLIFVSSTAVYGAGDGRLVDEQTAAVASSATSAVLLEAEQVASAGADESCLLRLGGIYGPGRERLIDQVRSGAARLPTESVFTNRIHRNDAARAIVHLALRDDPMPPAVIGVDDEPAELGDVLRFLAAELDLPVPQAAEQVRSDAPNRRMSNALLRSTGFAFTYPTYREGYRSVLEGRHLRHP